MSADDGMFEDPPGLDWAEVDLRDHLPSVGFGHLVTWQHAVSRQAERLAASTGTAIDVQADVYLFAQALRQVLRAAELVAEGLVGDPRQQTVESAIHEFNVDVPHAKDARDILDHFDDYARGIGRLSHPDARNTRDRKRGASAMAAREYRISLERDDNGMCILHLGLLTVDTGRAKAASERLAAAVLGVWWEPADACEATELFTNVGPDSPMFPVLCLLAIMDGTAPEDLLSRTVTPESFPLWDIVSLREVTSSYGLASRIAYGAADVAYVKLVRGGPNYPAVVREATLVEALVFTIQRREDLDGEWRIHQLGEAARPEELPRAGFWALRRSVKQLSNRLRRIQPHDTGSLPEMTTQEPAGG